MLQISYDGCPSLQNKQRVFPDGSPTSEIVEETIRFFVKSDKKFTVKIVVTKNSLGMEKQIVSNLSKLEAKLISFSQQDDFGRGKDYYPPSMDEFTEFMLKMEELCSFTDIKIIHGPIQSLGSKVPVGCGAGINVLSFGPEKVISGCLGFASVERVDELLNQKIYDDSEVNTLFFGKYDDDKKEIVIDEKKLNTLRDRINVHEICSKCEFLYFCGAGCPLKNALNTGELKKPFPEYCSGTKKMFRSILNYAAEKFLVRKYPYFEKKENFMLLRTQFYTFKISQGSKMSNYSDTPFIALDSKTDLKVLLFQILEYKNKIEGTNDDFVLFLISSTLNERDKNLEKKTGLLDFFEKLNTEGVFFLVTKPVFKCLLDAKSKKKLEKFNVPNGCFDCIELFYVQNGYVFFCNGKKGKQFDSYETREEIYLDFMKNKCTSDIAHTCLFCTEFNRKKCEGCCC